MRFAVLPLIAAFASVLVACERNIACTDLFAYSVSLQVEDADGAPIDDATVQYNVDGGAFSDCENLGGGNYACGGEEDGDLTVTVAWSGAEDTMDFQIESDECHVIGQSATFVMVP